MTGTASQDAIPPAAPPRAMGPSTLAAVGVNSIIGAGFYLLPAQYFVVAGAWAPPILLAVGVLMFAIALCFAEVGSRFSTNGGAYLYVRAAFGPLAGFQVGWLLYLSRVISTASMLAALVMLMEIVTGSKPSFALSAAAVLGLTVVVAAFSIIGGRANAGLVTSLAVIKVAPVILLLVLGLPQLDWPALAPTTQIPPHAVGAAAAMAMFSYAGFENLAIPAGEANDPQRDVPRALFISLSAGIVLLVGANAAAIGLVQGLGQSKLALADAAQVVMGPPGWWMIAVTAILAVVGSKAGSTLANSRLLQGLADQGDIPAWFGARSKRFGTPATAVVVSAALVAALALTGTFQSLVVLAVGTRVLVYASVALAAARLRAPGLAEAPPPARFRMPAPWLMVGMVLAGCGGILLQMTVPQMAAISVGLGVGLVLYAVQTIRRRRGAAEAVL